MRRVIEELCMDDACTREDSHWHPFDLDAFAREKPGEYTVTLRVREVKTARRRQSRNA
jgi:hypothetical protein